MWDSSSSRQVSSLHRLPPSTVTLLPALCPPLFLQHGTAGARPLRSPPTRPHLFPYTSEMQNLWGMLGSHPSADQLPHRRSKQHRKGANTIFSLLHHFLEHHGLGESHLHLHADNYVGQNKNNTMLHYLMWRVMVGLHRQITLSFLIVGHTKFAPDWCFGLLKQRFPRTKVSSLRDLENVVNCSAEANVAQLVGTQSGEVVVPTYDWPVMFAGRLRKLKHLKQFHHFSTSSSAPGSVEVGVESDSESEQVSLVMDNTWEPTVQQLPATVPPSILSLKRQWYLHNTIRMYCPEEVHDEVCPLPLTPLSHSTTSASSATTPTSSTTTRSSQSISGGSAMETTTTIPPPTKQAHIGGECHMASHNAHTCGK